MVSWVAVGYGALDVRATAEAATGVGYLVVPIHPEEPIGLVGAGSELWGMLASRGPIADSELSEAQRTMAQEMQFVGITSTDTGHAARVTVLREPWMSSPTHELVYALIANVARGCGIRCLFIKGPALWKQGLRDREHSGDVDVWVDPRRADELASAMEKWGWKTAPVGFSRAVYHSLTLQPQGWGCEIDLHYRFPGVGLPDDAAFETIFGASSEREYAGTRVLVPERDTHAVLLALHRVRPEPGSSPSVRAREEAASALARVGDDVIGAAERMGAVPALRPALADAFPGRELPSSRQSVPPDWQWRKAQSRMSYYVSIIRGLPWWERPQVIARMVWPRRDYVFESEERTGAQAASPIRARLRRMRRGAHQLWELRARRPEADGGD